MNDFSKPLCVESHLMASISDNFTKNPSIEPICEKINAKNDRELLTLRNIKVLGENQNPNTIQDYFTLRQQCLMEGKLFEDPNFPAINCSLKYTAPPNRTIEWKRPNEITFTPEFISSSWPHYAIKTGECGDQWILSAISTLAMNPTLFANVIPEDQSFREMYAGIFHFRFWQNGKWVDVVIDDRLPTYNGHLLFIHTPQKQDFWAALFEKAYAKFYECYETLIGLTVCEALEDFTGGIFEIYTPNNRLTMTSLYENILLSLERSSPIVCCKDGSSLLPSGIVSGHAYIVTGIKEINNISVDKPGLIIMIRLRYPYGITDPYRGTFNQQSTAWYSLSYENREKLKIDDNSKEFWMPLEDLFTNFDRLEICNLHPDSVLETDTNPNPKKFEVLSYENKWLGNESAGGCRNCFDKFYKNPQFIIQLESNAKLSSLIVGLTQKSRKGLNGSRCHFIGYIVYKLDDHYGNHRISRDFLKINISFARSPAFINTKEITNRLILPPGKYVIVPSTYEPDLEGEFLLRLFSDAKLTDFSPHQEFEPIAPPYIENEGPYVIPDTNPLLNVGWNVADRESIAGKLQSSFLSRYLNSAFIKTFELKKILDDELSDYYGQTEVVTRQLTSQQNATDTDDLNVGCDRRDLLFGMCACLILVAACGELFEDSDDSPNVNPNLVSSNEPTNICILCCDESSVPRYESTARPVNTTQTAITKELKLLSFTRSYCDKIIAYFSTSDITLMNFADFMRFSENYQKWRESFTLHDPYKKGKIVSYKLKDVLVANNSFHSQGRTEELCEEYRDSENFIWFPEYIVCTIESMKSKMAY